jgi:hypothetical protein
MSDRPQPPDLQISAEPGTTRGVFSNLVLIQHTREEFVIDFLLNTPAETRLQTRVVVTPEHAKRLAAALRDNIERYESGGGFQAANTEPA